MQASTFCGTAGTHLGVTTRSQKGMPHSLGISYLLLFLQDNEPTMTLSTHSIFKVISETPWNQAKFGGKKVL